MDAGLNPAAARGLTVCAASAHPLRFCKVIYVLFELLHAIAYAQASQFQLLERFELCPEA